MPRKFLFAAVLCAVSAAAHAGTYPGYGTIDFSTSCSPGIQPRLEKLIARLHSFDWVEPEAITIAKADPGCAMAWWVAAMSVRGNPLASPPDADAIKIGRAHIQKAKAANAKTERERGFIDALDIYYRDYPGGHAARTQAYEAAMDKLRTNYPDDAEVATFGALAILEAVDLTDKTYARQLKALPILEAVWQKNPDHPGAMHYLIHAADYTPLAERGLAAARRYSTVATAAAHAQHMPSHIYSMLGLWRDSIAANHAAAHVIDHNAHGGAKADVTDSHGLDFISYARLQLGEDREVARAIATAAPSSERLLVQARSVLERGDWTMAKSLPKSAGNPLDALTLHFTRSIAASRSGDTATATAEAAALRQQRARVLQDNGDYWAGLTDVYADAADGWIAAKAGRIDEAIQKMAKSADLDDAREKHIWLENKLLPMRELYGEMLLEMNKPDAALAAFETALKNAPNRLRSFAGAARAAKALGKTDEARMWYGKLAAMTNGIDTTRPAVLEARAALN